MVKLDNLPFSETIISIAVTGHRNWNNPEFHKAALFKSLNSLIQNLRSIGISKESITLIHGCARGIDLWFGTYARTNSIPYELYLPFPLDIQISKGKFSEEEEKELTEQIKSCKAIHVVNKRFSTYGYQKRNIALVDNCHLLTSYYVRSRSGSSNCVKYAKQVGRPVLNLRKK